MSWPIVVPIPIPNVDVNVTPGAHFRVLQTPSESPRSRQHQFQVLPRPRRRHGSYVPHYRYIFCREPPEQQDLLQVSDTSNPCSCFQDFERRKRKRRYSKGWGKRRWYSNAWRGTKRNSRGKWHSKRKCWSRPWHKSKLTLQCKE